VDEPALVIVLRRDRNVIICALGALAVVAWAYTLYLANTMGMGTSMSMNGNMPPIGKHMSDMAMPAIKAWSLPDVGFMLVMWTVMMMGMMTPSAAPMISSGERSQSDGYRRSEESVPCAETILDRAVQMRQFSGSRLADNENEVRATA
jgi:predicted metal-binding membrane protein